MKLKAYLEEDFDIDENLIFEFEHQIDLPVEEDSFLGHLMISQDPYLDFQKDLLITQYLLNDFNSNYLRTDVAPCIKYLLKG